jgi:NAD(P)-dependent dehydrogenase (short-subunit alcohol dehydrogenase family)
MHPYFSLQGRTALVTGGTRGIGKMIAKAYVEAGATVYVCARDVEACRQTADELGALGRCHAVAANLATEEGVQQLATRLGEQMTHLDILVNNAGTTWGHHWKATRSRAGRRSCN